MEQLIDALPDLKDLITGVITGCILLIIARLFKESKKLPKVFKNYQMASRKKKLIKIKNNRHDDRHYHYELQKAQNYFIHFLLIATVNISFLIFYNISSYSFWLSILFMIPTFILEIIWLNKLSYVHDLVVYQKDSLEWKKRRERKNQLRKKKIKALPEEAKALENQSK